MRLAEAGWIIRFDGSEKAYVGEPLSDEIKERRRQAWRRGWRDVAFVAATNHAETVVRKVTPDDVEAELDRMWDAHGRKLVWGISSGSGQEYLFNFAHLPNKQQREFVALFQSGKLNIGYPGRFNFNSRFHFGVEEETKNANTTAQKPDGVE